jgi:hypothetical protein
MEKVVDIANKITVLYVIHFGNKHTDLATCKDCVDYDLGLCSGGADNVLECMYDKAKKCEFFSNI